MEHSEFRFAQELKTIWIKSNAPIVLIAFGLGLSGTYTNIKSDLIFEAIWSCRAYQIHPSGVGFQHIASEIWGQKDGILSVWGWPMSK